MLEWVKYEYAFWYLSMLYIYLIYTININVKFCCNRLLIYAIYDRKREFKHLQGYLSKGISKCITCYTIWFIFVSLQNEIYHKWKYKWKYITCTPFFCSVLEKGTQAYLLVVFSDFCICNANKISSFARVVVEIKLVLFVCIFIL